MTKPTSPSAESMLKAVIEAQVRGGHTRWNRLLEEDSFALHNGIVILTGHIQSAVILEILLDPQGLRAAYPTKVFRIETGDTRKDILLNMVADHMRESGRVSSYHDYVAQLILMSWLSTPSGDALGAIRTAYELLPSVLIERISPL